MTDYIEARNKRYAGLLREYADKFEGRKAYDNAWREDQQ